jgi:hypothetical protein
MGNSEPNGADGKLVSQDRTLSSEDEPQKAVLDRVGGTSEKIMRGQKHQEGKQNVEIVFQHTHTHAPQLFFF